MSARRVAMCAVALLVAVGCKPAAPSATENASVALPPVACGTPIEAVRTAMETIRAEHAAQMSKNATAAAAARKQLRSLVALDAVFARVQPDLRANGREGVAERLVLAWSQITAYYVDQLQLDGMTSIMRGEARCDVIVPAGSGPKGATIRAECARENDAWHIVRMDYVVGATPSVNAAAPTTAPNAMTPASAP